ncbi:MAG: DUF134 domain-containing protein [Desulfovibrionaceae bacterium]
MPKATYFKPQGIPLRDLQEVRLSVEGLEALRLADLEGLTAEAAAVGMGVSRHTLSRLFRMQWRQVPCDKVEQDKAVEAVARDVAAGVVSAARGRFVAPGARDPACWARAASGRARSTRN